jgi:hypothetical protein
LGLLVPEVEGQAFDDGAVFIGNGGDGTQVVWLELRQLRGPHLSVTGHTADPCARSGDRQHKSQFMPLAGKGAARYLQRKFNTYRCLAKKWSGDVPLK